MNAVAGFAIMAMLCVIYLAPAIVANSRGHMSSGAILALNLLLGWTALGWIVAFVWSLTGNTRNNLRALLIQAGPNGVGLPMDSERQAVALERGVARYALPARWIPVAILGGLGLLWVIGFLVWEAADNRATSLAAQHAAQARLVEYLNARAARQ